MVEFKLVRPLPLPVKVLALLLKVTRTPLPDGCEPVFETDPDDT